MLPRVRGVFQNLRGNVLVVPVALAACFAAGFAIARFLPGDQAADVRRPQEQFVRLSQSDWEFLRHFDKPLVSDLPDDVTDELARTKLRSELSADFEATRAVITDRYPSLSETETLIAFLSVRVAQSIPVLDSGIQLFRSIKTAVLDMQGNCLHFAVRTAYVMDVFDVPARVALFSTPPYILGHAVADIYVPGDRLAALVDANKKFVFFLRDADASFFEMMLGEKDEKRRARMLDRVEVVEFPPDVRYFTPSAGHLASWVSGKRNPMVIEDVRRDLVEKRVKNTKAAFLEGYDRLFTQRTRKDEDWWLRIKPLEEYGRSIVKGLESKVAFGNERVQAILADKRGIVQTPGQ